MNVQKVKELFFSLCIKHDIDPLKIIRRHGTADVREKRMLIVREMYEAGAKTWQIKEIIPRDSSTLWHAKNKKL